MTIEHTYKAVGEPESSVILKYIRGNASEEEKAEVETWLSADPEHETVLLQIARIYYAERTHERIASRDSLRAYHEFEKRMQGQERRRWGYYAWIVAACFIGMLIVSTTIPSFWQKTSTAISQQVTVCANKGVRTSLNLPDGTVVYLNSGSTLSYSSTYGSEKERRVTLSGEAYFSVERDSKHPFIVSVVEDRMRVKVLGTEFNVQAYEQDSMIQTTLVSGAVNIETKDVSGKVNEINLSPSEKATYDLSKNIVEVEIVDVASEIAWKDGRLVFKETPLPEVLKQLTNFYNVDFEVQDSILNTYCFTGILQDRNLTQALDYLRISSRMNCIIKRVEIDESLSQQRDLILLSTKSE